MKKLPKLYQLGLRFPKTILVLTLLTAGLSMYIARGLQIETSMGDLAPKNADSVRSEQEYRKYFGGTSYLVMTVEGANSTVVEHFADEFSTRIEKLPGVDHLDYHRPVEYFKKRRWLYLSMEDLNEIDHRVDRVLGLEKKGVSIVFGDLMDFGAEEDRPDLNFDDILKKYENKPWVLSKFDANEGGNLIAMRAKVQEGAANIQDSRRLVDQIKAVENQIKGESSDYQSIQVGYTGPVQTTIEETDQIKKEMALVSLVVAAALFIIILVYFRKFSAILLIGIPLASGILWTGGLVYLLLGHLNLMTSFAGGILAGLGSDYGIYLLTRYYLEREAGKDFDTAARLAFANTGTATYASMLTTVGAFVALLFSKFGVFFEFGLLGAIGIVLNYVSMMVVLPSCLVLFNRWRKPSVKPVNAALSTRGGFFTRWGWIFTKKPVMGIYIAGLLTLFSCFTLPSGAKIHFEEDMMINKKLPANQLYKKLEGVKSSPLAPTIFLINGFDNATQTVNEVNRRVEEDKNKQLVYEQALGLSTFIPDEQSEKKEVLKSILQKVPSLRWLPEKQKGEWVASLKDSIAAEPVTHEKLPIEVKRIFESPKDKNLFAVYIFPAFNRITSEALEKYHQGIIELRKSIAPNVPAVDGTFIFDDIVQLIKSEAPRGMILICIFLAIVIYYLYRSALRTLIVCGNLFGSIILLFAVLWMADIPLNVMNISMIPVILGTGIDSFIHFAQRYDESKSMPIALREKIPAILFSNMTTIVGFAGLLLVSNPGLRSVGWVAALGLIVVTIVCSFVFPRCLEVESMRTRKS
jgi:hypothetical protein